MSTKNPSQTELYGEILTNESQYNKEVAKLPTWTKEEEQHLVVRAQQGDRDARDAILLSCQSYVRSVAAKYARTYAWASPRIEYLELVQIGNMAAIESFDKALASGNPLGFLRATMSWAIVHYCPTHISPITTPRDRAGKPLPAMDVESIDVPLDNNENETLADLIPETVQTEKERDYQPLYAVIEKLPEKWRETVTRHYGIGCAPESLNAIGLDMKKSQAKNAGSTICQYRKRAITFLYRELEPIYTVG